MDGILSLGLIEPALGKYLLTEVLKPIRIRVSAKCCKWKWKHEPYLDRICLSGASLEVFFPIQTRINHW